MIRSVESSQVKTILARKAARFQEAEAVVKPILEAVRKRGDKAVLEFAQKFDNLNRRTVAVPQAELQAAEKQLTPAFRAAVRTASRNIRAYAKLQMPATKSAVLASGLKVGQIVRPLDTVAAYIPSGRYPLPSTLMMTIIPAQVAGVPNIPVASPPPVVLVLVASAMLKAAPTI